MAVRVCGVARACAAAFVVAALAGNHAAGEPAARGRDARLEAGAGGGAPSGTVPQRSADHEAQALFEAMLANYAKDRDFRARFTETPISRWSGEGEAESGVVVFKRPGLWRWEYQSPERKLVVVRDGVATLKVEGDADASTYRVAGGPDAAADANGVGALLAGGEALSRRFVATFEPGGPEGEPMLRLDPVSLSDEFDHILVKVGRGDLRVRELIVEDPGGNRLRFVFDRFERNFGASDALFEPPASGRAPAPASRAKP